jgi:hypothetical protein
MCPQHDMVVDNGPGLTVRTDMNAALQALASQNAGPIEPTVKYAGMLWLDTTVAPDGLIRMRNQANNAWVEPTVHPATAGNIVVSVLTTSGTWTKPAGLRCLEVTAIGGGAGSTGAISTAAGQSSAGGGGGGGGTAQKLFAAASLPASVVYTVGANGGSPSSSGAAGGASIFNVLSAAGGGAPAAYNTGGSAAGTTNASSVAGIGGVATGGDLNINGGYGSIGYRAFLTATGPLVSVGGVSSLTTPHWYGLHIIGTAQIGQAGRFPGGGASGSANSASQASLGGAGGGAGCIILKEYF